MLAKKSIITPLSAIVQIPEQSGAQTSKAQITSQHTFSSNKCTVDTKKDHLTGSVLGTQRMVDITSFRNINVLSYTHDKGLNAIH